MADHVIILSKIEWTMDEAGGGGGTPEFWTNEDEVTEGCIAEVGDQVFIDVTRYSTGYGGLAYESDAANTSWSEGNGWIVTTAGDPANIANYSIALSASYEELYGNTIFYELGFNPYGAVQHPVSVRLTLDVTAALNGVSDDLEFYISHPDLFGEYYLVRRDGGSATSVPALAPITATGTPADIQQYVYTYDLVPTGSAQFDMEGIREY